MYYFETIWLIFTKIDADHLLSTWWKDVKRISDCAGKYMSVGFAVVAQTNGAFNWICMM